MKITRTLKWFVPSAGYGIHTFNIQKFTVLLLVLFQHLSCYI